MAVDVLGWAHVSMHSVRNSGTTLILIPISTRKTFVDEARAYAKMYDAAVGAIYPPTTI